MAQRRISLEISNSAVRMAEIAIGGARPELINLGQVGLPPRAVVDGAILDTAAVESALARCIKEGGFAQGGVHVGIAGLRVLMRELEMPSVPDAEIDAAVRLQALDVIPFPIDKAVLSARPLEEVIGFDGAPERRVLIAAAHRELIDPLLAVIEKAGLTPISIEPTSSAMIRALYNDAAPAGGPEAIVSIGSGLTTIVVHEDGIPHFVRTIAEGGDTVTAAIAAALDLPVADAESTKRTLDRVGPQVRVAAAAARTASMSLITELRNSIDYYATLPGRDPVRRVVISGGGSRLNGFLEQLQSQISVPIGVGNAFGRIDTSRLGLPPEEIGRLDESMSVVVGLALPTPKDVKQLDLLPPEFVLRRKRHRLERGVLVAAGIIVAAMVVLGVVRYLKVNSAESTVGTLQQQVATAQATIPKFDKVRQQKAQVDMYLSTVVPIVAQEVYWPAVLTDLKTYTPPPGAVTAFSGSVVPVPATSASLPPTQQQVAAISIGLSSTVGYPWFETWYKSVSNSKVLVINSFSTISAAPPAPVTFTSTLGVTALATTKLNPAAHQRYSQFKATS
jgi:type IV pilus assembly protein PilM